MIGNNFDTPIMYQDLADYTMNPMNPTASQFGMAGAGMYGGSMYGAGMYGANTSYLGNVQMRPQPDHDKLEVMNKKNQEGKNNFKKAMKAIGLILMAGFIPVVYKGIKKSGFVKYFKDLFSKKPQLQPQQQSGNGVKDWLASKWNAFKNLFKKKPETQNP